VPRTEAANQRIREQQRARILEAASEVFARRGLAATMAEVAAAAGVSQGLAYRYFGGKEELFHALVEQALASGDAASAVDEGTPGERLRALLTALLDARREHPQFFQLLAHVARDATTPPDLLRRMIERRQAFQRLLRQLIVEGQATGEVVQDDPDQLVTAILALIQGLTIDPQLTTRVLPDPEIVLRLLQAPTP
jgi:AcrR family transcriptional regulator